MLRCQMVRQRVRRRDGTMRLVVFSVLENETNDQVRPGPEDQVTCHHECNGSKSLLNRLAVLE
jgi:hypothetical protein